jgi:lactoylglutathione lyase
MKPMTGRIYLAGALLLSLGLSLPAAEPQRPRILGVAHISLYVHDLDKSRAFYGDFLGFQEPYSLKKPDGSLAMTFFKVNDRQAIELSPEKAPGTDRLNHYAIETDNAEAMRVYLQSQGVTVPDHVPKGRIGNLNFMIKDPEGHSVEIVQYPADSWTAQARGKAMSGAAVSGRLLHVGIIVTHFDKEMQFYEKVLGFQEFWRGSSTGKVLSWVNLRVPDGSDYIELMLYKDAPDATHRGTAHHLCLQVDDIAASVAKLNAKPYRSTYGRTIEIHTGKNRKRQANLFDPDGTRTELMESHTVDGRPTPSSQAPPPQ